MGKPHPLAGAEQQGLFSAPDDWYDLYRVYMMDCHKRGAVAMNVLAWKKLYDEGRIPDKAA